MKLKTVQIRRVLKKILNKLLLIIREILKIQIVKYDIRVKVEYNLFLIMRE